LGDGIDRKGILVRVWRGGQVQLVEVGQGHVLGFLGRGELQVVGIVSSGVQVQLVEVVG
jgi:hypothetical protein